MRAVSAVSALGVAAATTFIAVDRSCQGVDDPSGCKGGCYQWEDDPDFFGNCMAGKAPPVAAIMEDFVIVSVVDGVGDCAMRGFVPLKQVPEGSTAPDGCYGGAGTRVSFFSNDETWFWEAIYGYGCNPPVDCPVWQAANPTCFDGEPSNATGGGGFGPPGSVVAATSFIAVDRSCPDSSTGCKGGCYQWEDDPDFFGNCMAGKAPPVAAIMEDFVIFWTDEPLKQVPDCAMRGFVPLKQVPGGSIAPDDCYAKTWYQMSFFSNDETWFWDAIYGYGYNLLVDCPVWQAENPSCFFGEPSNATGGGGFGTPGSVV